MKKIGENQLFPIAALDSLHLCNAMIFSRNTKHLTILKVTEILTFFSADMPTWVNFISCNSKKRGKIQIVTYMTTYVRLERYGGPCSYSRNGPLRGPFPRPSGVGGIEIK